MGLEPELMWTRRQFGLAMKKAGWVLEDGSYYHPETGAMFNPYDWSKYRADRDPDNLGELWVKYARLKVTPVPVPF